MEKVLENEEMQGIDLVNTSTMMCRSAVGVEILRHDNLADIINKLHKAYMLFILIFANVVGIGCWRLCLGSIQSVVGNNHDRITCFFCMVLMMGVFFVVFMREAQMQHLDNLKELRQIQEIGIKNFYVELNAAHSDEDKLLHHVLYIELNDGNILRSKLIKKVKFNCDGINQVDILASSANFSIVFS